ncbi:hypothetical protein ANN_14504 [Periplaneta americana]|uniref:Uncharacterized protein n=1 Tax=Periplaneta americana TaxID=6978 RepID=A0ABQ8SY28_PERAM|nr:hypothetical protein ANN_14504 [Periplaneta americana]
MAGLCEGGNEPPGSLKARNKIISHTLMRLAWLSRLRRLPAGLKLRSGAGSIPTWADYLVGFFPRFSSTVSQNDTDNGSPWKRVELPRAIQANRHRVHGRFSSLLICTEKRAMFHDRVYTNALIPSLSGG